MEFSLQIIAQVTSALFIITGNFLLKENWLPRKRIATHLAAFHLGAEQYSEQPLQLVNILL